MINWIKCHNKHILKINITLTNIIGLYVIINTILDCEKRQIIYG